MQNSEEGCSAYAHVGNQLPLSPPERIDGMMKDDSSSEDSDCEDDESDDYHMVDEGVVCIPTVINQRPPHPLSVGGVLWL
ncbi:hypothetical protein L1887_27954 [Cichorium endivia]|nr:hypothetical protein L1887_27954 [Cichorium endivia]